MADDDVIRENGWTVMEQRHPARKGIGSLWNGVAIASALVLL